MVAMILTWISGISWLLIVEKLIRAKFDRGIILTCSFLVGLLANAWWLVLVQFVFGSWQREVVVGGQVVIVLMIMWFFKKRVRELFAGFKLNVVTTVLILGVVGFLGYGQLTNDYLHSDGLSLWFMHGKFFYLDSGVHPEIFSLPAFFSVNESGNRYSEQSLARYPILVPLNVAWAYALNGREAVTEAKWLWLGVELSIFFIMAYLGGFRLLLVTIGVPVLWRWWTPHWFGGADMWLAGYYLLGTGSIYFWLRKSEKQYLWLATILLGAAAATKVEGMVALVAVAMTGMGVQTAWLFLPAMTWYIYTLGLPIQNDYLGQVLTGFFNGFQTIERLVGAGGTMIKGFTDIANYLLVWPLAFSVLGYQLWKKRWKYMVLWLLPIAGWFFNLVSYAVNNLDLTDLIYASLPRLYSQWIPTVLFISSITLQELIADKKINKDKISKR